jgi:c-di-GMP-binding flagellar brake protein YcgR
MQDVERITGDRQLQILREASNDRVLLRMVVLGQNYDTLTIIREIEIRGGSPYMAIDHPQGFEQAVRDLGQSRMYFEFAGKDRVAYTFRTSGCEPLGDELWIKLPEVIERKQRRKDFRMTAPGGARMRFVTDDVGYDAAIENISMGGALILLNNIPRIASSFESGRALTHLHLRIPTEQRDLELSLHEGVIRRAHRDPLTGQHRYGVQFLNVRREDENALKEFVYVVQREFLRRRKEE